MHESKKNNCPCPQNGCVDISKKLHGKHRCPNCGIISEDNACPCVKFHCPCNAQNKDNYPMTKGKDCPCVTLSCNCVTSMATSSC